MATDPRDTQDDDIDANSEGRGFRSFDELSGSADSGHLSEDDLRAELQKYGQAYYEEFNTKQHAATSTDERVENVRDFFKNNMATAAAEIVFLSTNAESDSVKLSASKYILDYASKDAEKSDEIGDLLTKLQKQAAAS